MMIAEFSWFWMSDLNASLGAWKVHRKDSPLTLRLDLMTEQKRNTTGRVYGGETADERKARQRRTFLDAGLQLIGTAGYRATTIRALCKEAGLTDRYFYANFENTEALLTAVYEEVFEQFDDRLISILAEDPAARSTHELVVEGLSLFFSTLEDPRVARTVLMEVLGVSDAIDHLYVERIRRFAEFFQNIARHRVEDIAVPAEELKVLSVGLVGAITQTATQWYLNDYDLPRDTLVAANARFFTATFDALSGDR